MFALTYISIFLSTNLFAQPKHTPPSFKIANGANAVFVDFLNANYKINYDVKNKLTSAISTIEFEMNEKGFPIFDLVEEPYNLKIDGESVSQELISTPNNESKVRVIKKLISPGKHQLYMESQIKEGIKYTTNSVSSAFWTSDLDDRNYLEQYLPTNYEYDQYQSTFEIYSNGSEIQDIATNGKVKSLGINHYEIVFPEYFSTSSIFYHTFPFGKFNETTFEYISIDGRNIPIRIYSGTGLFLNVAKNKTIATLKELESDYGPFPHKSVTIYLAGAGGMEYCGATMTDIGALDHELTHSYFARGMLPANGNAGWMDEAIASWRDDGYKKMNEQNLSVTQMAAHNIYTRKTDTDAYDAGSRFMAYLHKITNDKGGLKSFLKQVIRTQLFTPITTEEFKSNFELFYGLDVSREYSTYIYGKSSKTDTINPIIFDNPKHQKMSVKEMQNFL